MTTLTDRIAALAQAVGADIKALLTGKADTTHTHTDSSNNTAVGAGTLQALTTGNTNTAVGSAALASLVEGYRNTAVGRDALKSLGEGTANVAVGGDALGLAGVAGANVALGDQAGKYLGGGSRPPPNGQPGECVYVGYDSRAGYQEVPPFREIVIGARTIGAGSNTVTLGSPSNTLTRLTGHTLQLTQSRTPASSTDAGAAGSICWDADYLYVCVATDTWRRIAHTSW